MVKWQQGFFNRKIEFGPQRTGFAPAIQTTFWLGKLAGTTFSELDFVFGHCHARHGLRTRQTSRHLQYKFYNELRFYAETNSPCTNLLKLCFPPTVRLSNSARQRYLDFR
jgi:hypothetical protein